MTDTQISYRLREIVLVNALMLRTLKTWEKDNLHILQDIHYCNEQAFKLC